MSIWLLLVYAAGMLAAIVGLNGQAHHVTLSLIVPAAAMAVFVLGLLLRGVRPPVI